MMEALTLPIRAEIDVSNATFDAPDLTTFYRLDVLGLEVVGQFIEPGRVVVSCCRRRGPVPAVRVPKDAAGHGEMAVDARTVGVGHPIC